MYKRKHNGWIEYTDFIILELLTVNVSFLLAYCFRHGWSNLPYKDNDYLLLIGIISLFDIVSICLFEAFENVLSRSAGREIGMSLRHIAIVFAELTLYLFAVQESATYSRITLFSTFMIDLGLGITVRLIYKRTKSVRKKHIRTFMVVTTSDRIMDVLNGLGGDANVGIKIAGIALVDKDYTGCSFDEIPVVATVGGITEYIRKAWIDEVFLAISENSDVKATLIKNLAEMGVTLHVDVEKISGVPESSQIVENIGAFSVVTSSISYASPAKLLVKRIGDVLIGFIGCIFTVIIGIILAPVILIKSPGPLFFVQERIGQNGKRFKMLKFRSMVTDAESKKKQLMDQNTMSDDKMFKLDFDPRVIGNKLTADGKRKTGIGEFIRKTSLDEFPQFFNVLKGDMSLVGTRPPTADEWERYELHHRARLATKPGITGLWQISGRSDIKDFEEVVKLDTEYIYNWSIGMDIKILFKTVGVVIKGRGAK
ncbi:MAG: sugar transferase [Lachnospiraceae bacterium]|nr:sugar transferase [Lachnospiraceae bacterium]